MNLLTFHIAKLSHRRIPRVSVVVPCFNEQEVIEEAARRLNAACVMAVGDAYEIVYIDDGSDDCTWKLLEAMALKDSHVVAASLSRNFGHQFALSAGLTLCRGERILMIDADLQDPPELLEGMMRVMDGGADVVYGERIERKGETAFKKSSADVFYRLLNRLTDVEIPENTGDFRLVTRRVLDALLAMPEHHRFVRGLFAWLGFHQIAFPYVREQRFAGVTKYPLKKMLRLAIDAITGFSIVPLRASIWFALLSFLIAFGVMGYALVSWLFFDTVRGWSSLTIIVALFASVQLLCLGILGEYVGRMFMEVKQRPLFLLREVVVQPIGETADTPPR